MPLIRLAAAATLVGLLAVPGVAHAETAPCAAPQGYGATAAADLVRLARLDLRPLGVPVGPVAGATLASTRAGMVAGSPDVKSAAAARTVDAKLTGAGVPAGRLGTVVHQQAPPTNQNPATADAAKQDLGVLRLGAGDLQAQATWAPAMACGKEDGQNSTASASLAEVAVLPGAGSQALVRLPGTVFGSSATGLNKHRAVAAAQVGLAGVRLFAGSLSQVTVRVVQPPTLRVGTGGTRASATVEYGAPVLEVSGPGIAIRRLDTPGDSVDLAVPSSLPFLDLAREVARQEGLPLVGKGTLDDLVDGVARGGGRATGGAGQGQLPLLGLPVLPGVPDLTPAAELIGGVPPAVPAVGTGAVSVVRLSIGRLEQQVTDRAVRAEAAAVRVQVLAGPRKASSVLDLGVGMLSAAAVAPAAAGASADGPTPVTSLPVTGRRASAVAGTGGLLVAGGASLVIFTRRRRVSRLR